MMILVIGAGGWGTAISILLSKSSEENEILIWDYFPETLEHIKNERMNPDYLPNIEIPGTITPCYSLDDGIEKADIIFSVVPSIGLENVKVHFMNKDISGLRAVVSATKGFHIQSKKRVSEIWHEILGNDFENKYLVLSGPSHAEEVAKSKITAISIASKNIELAREISNLVSNEFFRAYSAEDIIGVELGGALKNIMAIGAGIIDGLELGDNAKAAFITRSLYEIIRFGTHFGAKKDTFFGLSGLGDLIVTCSSVLSRNHFVGVQLAQGKKIEDIINNMKMVAEGVKTTKIVYEISKEHDLDMPITGVIHDILMGSDLKLEIKKLMTRSLKDEVFY